MAWFYNRPGVTRAEYAADLAQCRAVAEAIQSSSNFSRFSLNAGLIGALMDAAMQAGPMRGRVDDCMIARSYRRFTAPDASLSAFRVRFDAMNEAAQMALISAETPSEGTLARHWGNSYWIASEGEASIATPRRPVNSSGSVNPLTSRGRVDELENIGPIALGQNEALVLVTLHGPNRERPPPLVTFHGQTSVPVGPRQRSDLPWFLAIMSRSAQTNQTFAYIVPANTYTLSNASAGGNLNGVQFCYGAPGFSVAAGEVVYIGEVHLQAGARQVDAYDPPAPFGLRFEAVNMEAARALLQQTPNLAARLRKADFQNGYTRPCVSGFDTYGIDMPGVAWRETALTNTSAAPTDALDAAASAQEKTP